MKKHITIIVLVGLIIGVASYFMFRDTALEPVDMSGTTDNSTDVVGTRTGTSTDGVVFGDAYNGGIIATTTYIKKIARRINEATFTLAALNTASSTSDGTLNFNLFGSNDYDCNTATTSQDVGNPVLMRDINWYDIGDRLEGLTGSLTGLDGVATTTIPWNPTVIPMKKNLVFEKINYECLRLDVGPGGASSTDLYVGLITK